MSANAQTEADEAKPAPVHEIRVRSVKAAIWANIDDRGRVHYSTTVSNSYRDEDGKWKHKKGYDFHELPALGKASDLAETWIIQKKAEPRATVTDDIEDDEVPY